jgi:hypothetical protein
MGRVGVWSTVCTRDYLGVFFWRWGGRRLGLLLPVLGEGGLPRAGQRGFPLLTVCNRGLGHLPRYSKGPTCATPCLVSLRALYLRHPLPDDGRTLTDVLARRLAAQSRCMHTVVLRCSVAHVQAVSSNRRRAAPTGILHHPLRRSLQKLLGCVDS